jgi:3',5'-cyclic AMP phosphodiesterase CpdA
MSERVLRIAHISDLHLLSLDPIPMRRMLNKRFTGWVNIKLRRGSVHKREVAQAVAREVARGDFDHVVITGDVTNLALEAEFEVVRRYLEEDLAMPPDRVSMVPGNHDAYTRGAHADRRFQCFFGEYITSDLPGASGVPGVGRFPYVRLRGPVAVIGLSSAVPRLPMRASGRLGKPQRMALHALLEHDEVRDRTPVILQHHPWHQPPTARKRFMQGLEDAEEELDVLRTIPHGLLLHGHLHTRVHRTIRTDAGAIDAIGSTSASLLDDDQHRMSGFNVYEVDAAGLQSVTAFRYAPDGSFSETTVPRA